MNRVILMVSATALFLIPGVLRAAENPYFRVVDVYEDPGFKKASAGLSPDGRELLAAELNIEMRQYPQAVPILKKLVVNHNDAEMWNLLAFSNNRVGQWKEGLDACDHSINLKPQLSFCYGERGVAEYHLGKIREAERDLSLYLRANGRDASARYYRGLAYARMGRLVEARAEMVRARSLKPLMGTFTDYNIALIDAARGHYKDALKPMKEIYGAYKEDDDQFSRRVEKQMHQLRALDALQGRSAEVRQAVSQADAHNAASHLPR